MAAQLFVGIDMGSTKFSTTVATVERDGTPRYVGHGSTQAGGIQAGELVDLVTFNQALRLVLDEARFLSGQPVEDVVVSVAGAQLTSSLTTSQTPLVAGTPISQRDVDRVVASARQTELPGRRTVHRIVQGFSVDGEGVQNPIGRAGKVLEVWMRDYTVDERLTSGIVSSAASQGVRVHALVPGGVAAAEAVLRPDERERGVILIDIGGANTDVALFVGGNLYDLNGFHLGGRHISRDLATILELPLDVAETLKQRCGVSSGHNSDLGVDWGPRGLATLRNQARAGTLSREVPKVIAGARLEQILVQARRFIQESAPDIRFHAGVVLTGGSSRLPGIDQAARQVLGLDVRCGDVLAGSGFPAVADPAASVSIGLVRYTATRGSARPHPRDVPPEDQLDQGRRIRTPSASQVRSRLWPRNPAPGSVVQPRQWSIVMRDWMRDFIPARGDI